MELQSCVILRFIKPGFSSRYLEPLQMSGLAAFSMSSGTDLESMFCELNLSILQFWFVFPATLLLRGAV